MRPLFLLTLISLSIFNFPLYAQCWQTVSAGSAHTLAIKPDGTLWAWGFNGDAQLGDGTTSEKSTPTQIGTDSNWKSVSAGNSHSLAIKTDGTLWAWGDNLWGQLGIGSFGDSKNTPTKIGTSTSWKSIHAGQGFSIAIKTDGTLWSWGDNLWGQLGNQNFAVYQPTQVGTATDWKSIAVGSSHVLAIKTDGTLWTWGYNFDGQLGDGTVDTKTTPNKIGTSTNWQSVSAGYDFSIAIKTDGTLWAWGNNDSGQLGDNTVVGKNAPIQIGSASDWQSISTGYDNSLAIKTDGTLWAWGYILGGVAFGEEDIRKIPTQIGGDLNWQSITSGDQHSFAFKTDGTLWGWGDNTWGRLGDGTWVDQSEPQVSPAKPTGESTQQFCNAALVADLQAIGEDLKWYDTPLGGSPLALDEELTNSNHYYASQAKYGCESSRLEVTVSINTTPTPSPTGASSQIVCSGSTLSSLTVTGTNVKWYTASSGGSPLPLSTLLQNEAHYFASQTIDACESSSRLEVIVTVNTTEAPTASNTQSFCDGTTIASLLATGTSIKWYATPTGGAPLPTNTTLSDENYYYGSQTINSLESCSRIEVLVKLNYTSSPTGAVEQAFCNAGTVGDLFATGTDIQWYDVSVGGLALDSTIPLVNGNNYYASQTINSCESFARFAVDVLINTIPTPAPTGNSIQKVCPGSTLESLTANGNDIQWYATDSDEMSLAFTSLAEDGFHYYASQIINGCESTARLDVTTIFNTTPPPILTITNWKAISIATGHEHSLAIMSDGTLWAWGNNNHGQLGDGTNINHETPVLVSAETNWESIFAGASHSLAIKHDGTLWAWGFNGGGGLGDGTTIDRKIPTQIGSDTNWSFISAGDSHSLAIKSDGTLWAWGWNYYGQVGDGSRTNRKVPTRIGTTDDWKSISAGGVQSVAIKNNGTLWSWGKIGISNDDGVTRPIELDFYEGWESVSAGSQHILGIRTDGTLWAWGSNEYRQVGNGTSINSYEAPQKISTSINWKSVSAGQSHSLAIQDDGTLWAWGQNAYGQLGLGVINEATVPTKHEGDNWQAISAGGYFSLAVKTDGTLWAYGRNSFGEVGDASTVTKNIPTLLKSNRQNFCPEATLVELSASGTDLKWYDVEAGGLALSSNTPLVHGDIYYATQTINSLESCSRLPVNVTTNATTSPVGSSSQMLCEGSNVSDLAVVAQNIQWFETAVSGSPIDPSTLLVHDTHYFASQVIDNCESPTRLDVHVSLNNNHPAVPTGSPNQSFCSDAVILDLTASGENIQWYESEIGGSVLDSNETLVDGKHYFASQEINSCESPSRLEVVVSLSTKEKPLPVSVVSVPWQYVSTFSSYTLGIKNDGTLWSWGDNYFGQLGNGTAYNYLTNEPAPVATDGNWISIGAGENHSVGIRADGTLWAWGDNHAYQYGKLGDGKGISKSLPIQVGTATNWKTVSVSNTYTIALKTDGTLWAWGGNQLGQLGDGTYVDKSTPVQIGSSTDWVSISAGWLHAFAVKSDGSLWAWGYNGQGQLGNGSTSSKNIPTRIGTEFNWKYVAASVTCSFGIKNDGTLWAWGRNTAGEFGNGTYTSSLIPKKINNDTNWKFISAGIEDIHILAIKTDGTLWGWGVNIDGQLGNGTYSLSPKITPEQIGTSTDWQYVDVGRRYSIAVKKDGTLWSWGKNNIGQLGLGISENSYNTPQLIASTSTIATQQLCSGATVGDLVANGTNIKWYLTPINGSPLSDNLPIASGVHYFASQTNEGCESERLEVIPMISERPTAPEGSTLQTFCEGSMISDLIVSGTDIKWYNENSGGNLLSVSTMLVNGEHYFASQAATICESVRLDVTAIVNTTASPTGNSNQELCAGSTIEDLAASGTDVTWYSLISGGSALSSSTPLVDGSHYYASQIINACESTSRLEVIFSENPIPPAPTGLSPQSFENGQTISDLVVTGNNVKWYNSSDDAVNRVNALSSSTELLNNSTYYATQTILECVSAESLPVTVSIITGIETAEYISEVYPNPVKDVLNISSPFVIDHISIMNLIGETVLIKPINTNQTTLDLTTLRSGVYILHLQFSDKLVPLKIVKQ